MTKTQPFLDVVDLIAELPGQILGQMTRGYCPALFWERPFGVVTLRRISTEPWNGPSLVTDTHHYVFLFDDWNPQAEAYAEQQEALAALFDDAASLLGAPEIKKQPGNFTTLGKDDWLPFDGEDVR